MTDREMLELAAKAAGLDFFWVDAGPNIGSNAVPEIWNPLNDDGDALRLAVKLGIKIDLHPSWVYARAVLPDDPYEWREITEGWGITKDSYAATRRAIVRAAAAIGEAMP